MSLSLIPRHAAERQTPGCWVLTESQTRNATINQKWTTYPVSRGVGRAPDGKVSGGSHQKVSGFKLQGAGSRVQGLGFKLQGSGFRVQGSGFRVQGAGCGVQGSGFVDPNARSVVAAIRLTGRSVQLTACETVAGTRAPKIPCALSAMICWLPLFAPRLYFLSRQTYPT